MGAGYDVAPPAVTGLAGSLRGAADGVTATGEPELPDAGDATGAMVAMLGVLTGASGILADALRSTADRAAASGGTYAGLDDAARGAFTTG